MEKRNVPCLVLYVLLAWDYYKSQNLFKIISLSVQVLVRLKSAQLVAWQLVVCQKDGKTLYSRDVSAVACRPCETGSDPTRLL